MCLQGNNLTLASLLLQYVQPNLQKERLWLS